VVGQKVRRIEAPKALRGWGLGRGSPPQWGSWVWGGGYAVFAQLKFAQTDRQTTLW